MSSIINTSTGRRCLPVFADLFLHFLSPGQRSPGLLKTFVKRHPTLDVPLHGSGQVPTFIAHLIKRASDLTAFLWLAKQVSFISMHMGLA